MGGRTHGKDTITVLAEIQKHHPNLIYDKFEYKNCNTKLIIGCKIHGYFKKYPNDMKQGRGGCPKCNKSFHRTHIEFIAELATLHPELECVDVYINSITQIKFRCITHNYLFSTQPYSVIAGHINCPECSYKKFITTKIELGQITDPLLKSDYQIYKQIVWKYSNRNYKTYLSDQKRDRQNHLDHVLSIVDGFKNNIPPEIVGSIYNLRIISGQANRHKSHRSDITIEQLLERYNK